MPDLILDSLRGGMNNTDPPIAVPGDQCVLALNVEWVASMLGERRKGSIPVTLGGSIASASQVLFLHRHLPTSNMEEAELYAMGTTAGGAIVLSRKSTAWGDVSIPDAPVGGQYVYQWDAVNLHGKSYFAYKSNVDRLHLVDGANATTMRRAGLEQPSSGPTVTNTGTAGTYAGTRYFRTRFTTQNASGQTVTRSEPSVSTAFTPPGTVNGAVINRAVNSADGATHWEVEASTGNYNFYRIATLPLATGTYTDTTPFVNDYTNHPLSEDIGDYALLPSARYLTVDDDRLIWGGSYENEAMQARVGWTPVRQASGSGNDERMESDTDPTLDLDAYNGGALTGLTSPVLGSIIAFKYQHIYKLIRTGERVRAYQALMLTDARGALHGSAVEGMDEQGRPCVYFLDPFVGPSIFGVGGIRSCGLDIFATWRTANLQAAQVLCRGTYYPTKQQVHWWVATGSAIVPNLHLVLHVQHMRQADDGFRKGWAIWTGHTASALCVARYADNINAGGPRSKTVAMLIGLGNTTADRDAGQTAATSLVQQLDVNDNDDGTAYSARILDHPRTATTILDNTGIKTGALIGRAAAGAVIDVKIQRDYGLETETVGNVGFTPVGTEVSVIRRLDNLSISECAVIQVEFADTVPPVAVRWQLNQFVLRGTTEQRT